MKNTLAAIIAITVAMSAQAHNTEHPLPPPVVVVSAPHSDSHSTSSSESTARQHQKQTQRQKQRQAQHQTSRSVSNVSAPSSAATADSNNADQYVTYSNPRNPASTAFAPSIQPTVNCAGSIGLGGQGASFGLSVGGTHIDPKCQRQELAKTALGFGDKATAEEILCGDDDYYAARKRAGRPCAKDPEEKNVGYTGNDPIVRRRLGLR
jgi:hypothetical protein